MKLNNQVVTTQILFMFTPIWWRWTQFDSYVSGGWEKPTTRQSLCCISGFPTYTYSSQSSKSQDPVTWGGWNCGHHLWHYVGTLHWMMAAMNDMELIHSITRCWQRFTKNFIKFQILNVFVHFCSKTCRFFCFTDPISLVVPCFLPSDGCFHLTTRGVPGRGATLLQEGSQPHQARGPETWGKNGWDDFAGDHSMEPILRCIKHGFPYMGFAILGVSTVKYMVDLKDSPVIVHC